MSYQYFSFQRSIIDNLNRFPSFVTLYISQTSPWLQAYSTFLVWNSELIKEMWFLLGHSLWKLAVYKERVEFTLLLTFCFLISKRVKTSIYLYTREVSNFSQKANLKFTDLSNNHCLWRINSQRLHQAWTLAKLIPKFIGYQTTWQAWEDRTRCNPAISRQVLLESQKKKLTSHITLDILQLLIMEGLWLIIKTRRCNNSMCY